MSVPNANGLSADVATDFAQFAGLRAAAKRSDPQALRQAARQFEAMFTEMLLKTSRETKFGDDLTGEQGDLYKDMFDQQMALHMASGKGMGLADMLVRQLGGLNGAAAGQNTAQVPGAAAASAGSAAAGTASSGWKPGSAQEFVDAVRPHAEKAAAELGVPAKALIAQAALETGWGQHVGKAADGSSGFNLFGIKAQPGWTGGTLSQATAEFENGQWITGQANFRSYGSIGAAFDDYVKFLKDNPRYADALKSGNVQGFADGLQKAGYATDPQYAQKLLRVANSVQLGGAYQASAVG